MTNFFEMINKYNVSVKIKPSSTTETNKDFEKLKRNIKSLNKKTNIHPS